VKIKEEVNPFEKFEAEWKFGSARHMN